MATMKMEHLLPVLIWKMLKVIDWTFLVSAELE